VTADALNVVDGELAARAGRAPTVVTGIGFDVPPRWVDVQLPMIDTSTMPPTPTENSRRLECNVHATGRGKLTAFPSWAGRQQIRVPAAARQFPPPSSTPPTNLR